jgi:formate dehydrogenase-N alpha subunit
VASLAASFGRGAMTNHWIDLENSDLIMVIGSNAAENHPISFRWVQRALDKGAKLISVDPRFTRTSALSDLYVPLRSGTDIAFIGALIRHALDTDTVHRDYLVTHTNAAFLVDPGFSFDDGLFGSLEDGKYTKGSWGFQKDADGVVLKDPTLSDPNCVYQLMKGHFDRYTFEHASRITGSPEDKLREVADLYVRTASPEKSATIMYAMGTTQHTHGTQNIRSYVILQLLMGNIGVAGGGINALRGESNVQGSTDHCLLFHILPGYLKCPAGGDTDLATYLEHYRPVSADGMSGNWWQHYPKYITSLLKAFWGENATPENDFAYSYLPKRAGGAEVHSHIALFETMATGSIEGLLCLGQNPAVGGPNSNRERGALGKLKWMVAVDLWDTETMSFWDGPGVNPADIQTEVFALPAAASMEKEGSVSNSGRWAQWRYAAAHSPGEAKSDLWILDRIQKKLVELYAEGGAFPAPIVELNWNYGDGEEPDPHLVAREINGYFTRDVEYKGKQYTAGQLVPNFVALKDDGSTCSGNWLYSGSYTEAGNMMARRERSNRDDDPIGLNPKWSWCWPVNRRIIYNRASCDAQGKPYAPHKPVVAYDWGAGKWKGDVPDGGWPPMEKQDGTRNPKGKYSFIMRKEGHACLFAPSLADGPFPEHYEPLESPTRNTISSQQNSPVIKIWQPDEVGDRSEYPIVATTYRVSEHWQAGAMTRNLPWLVELQPSAFVEISRELADEKGLTNGDKVKVTSARGEVELYALVTRRLRPMQIHGETVHQVGLIWHFGYRGLAKGPSANLLTPHVGDGNTMIPEYKAFLCDVIPLGSGGAA